MRRCRALDDEGLEWIEEPVLADDLQACACIAAAVHTPIQIGENFHGPGEMRAAIAAGAMDLVMPDVQFVYGVTGWLEAAALARAAGLPMSSHIFVEASAQLLCATPTAHWLEVLDAAAGPASRLTRAVRRQPAPVGSAGHRAGVVGRRGRAAPRVSARFRSLDTGLSPELAAERPPLPSLLLTAGPLRD